MCGEFQFTRRPESETSHCSASASDMSGATLRPLSDTDPSVGLLTPMCNYFARATREGLQRRQTKDGRFQGSQFQIVIFYLEK